MTQASIKIINNQKLNMTAEEHKSFSDICQSYDRPNFSGIDLFRNLFETDKLGNITLIKPPSSQTSFEIFLFVVALYEGQGRRIMEANEEKRLNELTEKFDKRIDELTAKYEEKLKSLKVPQSCREEQDFRYK